jgi:hypothetical protein
MTSLPVSLGCLVAERSPYDVLFRDERNFLHHDFPEAAWVALARRDHEYIDAAADHLFDLVSLKLGLLVRWGDEETVPLLSQNIRDALRDL